MVLPDCGEDHRRCGVLADSLLLDHQWEKKSRPSAHERHRHDFQNKIQWLVMTWSKNAFVYAAVMMDDLNCRVSRRCRAQ